MLIRDPAAKRVLIVSNLNTINRGLGFFPVFAFEREEQFSFGFNEYKKGAAGKAGMIS